MKYTFTFTKDRWLAFALSMVLPILAMAYGVFGLIFHVCINRFFFFTFILFPMATVGLLALCIFSGIRRHAKAIVSILLLLFFVIAYLNGVLFGTFVRMHRYQNDKVPVHYTSVTEGNKLMPSLDNIGHPIKTVYYDVFTKYFCFFARADYLICHYDSEEYALQKKQLDANYIFQTETMVSCDHPCEPSEEVDGYQFHVLSTKGEYEPFVDYPWYITLIAYNDEKQEIVYLSYSNTDIDYLTSLSDFLHEECGWSQVR